MSLVPIPVDPFGPFHVGDVLTVDAEVELTEDDEALGLGEASYAAQLVPPDRIPRPLAVERDDDVLKVTTGVEPAPLLTEAGIGELRIILDGIRLVPVRFVVEDDTEWLSLADARADWADAPTSDVHLFRLLESAREACEEYAPARKPGTPLKASWLQAQLMQARATYTASRTGPGDNVGADGMTVQVFPLDWTIKQLLRPKRGKPVVR